MLGKSMWGMRWEKHVGIDLEAGTLDETSAGLTWCRVGICSAAGLQVN